MPRKATITQKEIVGAAFRLTRKEGFEAITSRKLAAAAGCSTQPIFRIYEGMADLKKDVYTKAVEFYEEFYDAADKSHDVPFVDLGLCYINFAQRNPHLFRLLFLSEKSEEEEVKSMYDLVNGEGGHIAAEISKAQAMGADNVQHLFMQMWIFIHGAACMAVSGDYDLADADTVSLLTAAYHSFSGV
ncbi:MAG: TetR/AcrR family transcriptional regulator [Lachnospiraceae bacterium]|nr:TetR/AcrR family transcriptional regulator [Lachnospiraceae bacterium]